MYILTPGPEDVTHLPTTNNDSSAASTASACEQSVPGKSGKEDNPTYFFSRELALKLNPARPDINASIILFGLWLLQKMPLRPYQYQPMVNGKRGCYASLRELEARYPWLRHHSILKVLRRAVKRLKGRFVIDDHNEHARQGKLHFWISPKLIKEYRFDVEKHRGLLELKKQDVVRHGLLGALLIANLEWIVDETRNTDPVEDDAGNIFRCLSPTVLSEPREYPHGEVKPILPASRKAITEALSALKAANVFKEHPTKNNFYTPASTYLEPKHVVTKVNGDVTKVTTLVTKVNGASEPSADKASCNNDLRQVLASSYTNSDANPATKCLLEEPSSLRSDASSSTFLLSEGAKKLMALVNEEMAAFRRQQAQGVSPIIRPSDHAVYEVKDGGIHNERLQLIGYDFFYDWFPVDPQTGRLYTRDSEIDHIMEEIFMKLDVPRFKCTQSDMAALRQIFVDHPTLNYEAFEKILYHLGVDLISSKPDKRPATGYDWSYFGRRVKSVRSLLRYLPQLIKEMYVLEAGFHHFNHLDVTGDNINLPRNEAGKPMFDYSEMPEPFFSMVFASRRDDPVTYNIVRTYEKVEIKDMAYERAMSRPDYRRRYQPRYETVTRYEHIPVYYDQIIADEVPCEEVQLDKNPIAGPNRIVQDLQRRDVATQEGSRQVAANLG